MGVREITAEEITSTIRQLCIEANTILGDEVVEALKKGLEREESKSGKDIFRQLLDNAKIAEQEGIPLCQDTGMVVVFIEMGQDIHIVHGELNQSINEGVRQGYRDGYLRASTLDPLVRKNFGDNTPAIIHVEIVPGDKLKLTVVPKGFGGENMSRVALLTPASGMEGIKEFVLQTVEKAGANPCPPVIVGVGIGGTLEKAAFIAKKSLLRPIGQRHPDHQIAILEQELLDKINRLGIGPQGLGGNVTALDVHIETYPTHIAGLPIAVNLQCNCHRHKEAVL
ncbi:MAG: fumarate hydratase [Deltaproteobacteria bacterium]|nr:fumarate hydratase [Deltaproteobacteria bacterium]